MKFILCCVLMMFVAYSYADDNLKKFACEGNNLKLECKSGGSIVITNATFGRVSNDICPDKTLGNFAICQTENTYNKVKTLCNGKQSCVIQATSEYFGNACPKLSKYLEVEYKCRSGGSIDSDDGDSSSQTTSTTTEEPDISIEIETRPPDLKPIVLVNPAYATTRKPARSFEPVLRPAPVPFPMQHYPAYHNPGFQFQAPNVAPILPILPVLPFLPLAPLIG